MKTVIKIFFCSCISLLFLACERDTLFQPEATMEINKTEFGLNETMDIQFTGIGDQVVIYTGDVEHNYELRNEGNTGFVVNKGRFSYSYSTTGVYKVVCIASTYNDLAETILRDTCSYTVTVVDDNTEIERLSCPQILYDEVFAERLPHDEWLMKLPRQVMYNNRPANIGWSERLRVYLTSDLASVTVNGELFEERTKYDLSTTVNINVTSDKGTERSYKLYTLYYPEFATFNIAGVEGELTRNIFDYSSFEMSVTLPEGTNVQGLIPMFTTYEPTDKVYIDEVEQISGVSTVDFSQAITYRLISTLDGQVNKQAESTIKVKIAYE